MAFGLTPKHSEEYFLDGFTVNQYLVLAVESAKKLNWDISVISETGFIAFLNKGVLKWNAKITFKIEGNAATLKSESIGNEIIDWGKNKKNIEEFTEALVDCKSEFKTEDLDIKYEELKPNLSSPDEEENQSGNGFLSLFIPREGYFVTPILIALNILVFIIMICTGVHFFQPEGESLLNWGANFRPLTMAGEWWRLLTCCFIHIGFLHLLMNMYALLYIGMLLEPHIGSGKFAASYLITGITGSIASLWWHDLTVSAGASGAIFGMYGVFLALLTTNLIEKKSRQALLTSIGIFVAYNLMNGLKDGIDNAAHLGGLIGGIIVGFSFYPSLVKPELKTRNLIISLTSILVILVFSLFLIQKTPVKNSSFEFDKIMKEFTQIEDKAMCLARIPQNSPNRVFLDAVNIEGIPNWKKCLALVNKVDSLEDLPNELKEKVALLKKYCNYRITCFELIAEALENNTDAYDSQIEVYNQKIDLVVNKLNGEVVVDSLLNLDPLSEFAPDVPENILYVVDGTPVDNVITIKSEIIKSVIVLKPENSYSLYGEKGKMGAVLIETKK